MIDNAPGAWEQPSEIVDELVADPGGAARKQAGTFAAVVAGARRRVAERDAVAQHVLRRSGRGSPAAALAALEAQVKAGVAVGHASPTAQDDRPPGRGGIKGARLDPRRRKPAKVGLGALVGRDVEVVTAGGGRHRGELLDAGGDWLTLLRHGGRLVVVRASGVVAITEETTEVPR